MLLQLGLLVGHGRADGGFPLPAARHCFGLIDPAPEHAVNEIQISAHARDCLTLFNDHRHCAGLELFGKTTTHSVGHDGLLFVDLTV